MKYSDRYRRPASGAASTLLLMSLAALVASCQAAETADGPEAAPVGASGGSGSTGGPTAALPPGSDYESPAFEFEEVVPGIYHARGTGNLSVGSHGAVIVNEDDVLVVDSHISPAAARALLEDLKAITDKPVRYVVNTHYHFDHAHGNQIYGEDVHVIGHETTREMLLNGGSTGRSYDMFVGTLPDQIAAAERQLADALANAPADVPADAPADAPDQREALEARLANLRNYLAGQEGLEPTGPNTTLSERLTLFRGDREIRLLFFGRGHTGGDVVVHLPGERIVITGDLLVPGLPYMGDGYLGEWIETLEHVKSLEFDWALPGHGSPFQDKERIGYLQAYMRDLQARATTLHAQGLSFEDAAARIDMTDHAEHYPDLTAPGVAAVAVQRIFELLDGDAN